VAVVAVTDQGWMVDDGTCDACVRGNHHRCTKAQEWATDDYGVELVCCCNEGYHIGYVEFDP